MAVKVVYSSQSTKSFSDDLRRLREVRDTSTGAQGTSSPSTTLASPISPTAQVQEAQKKAINNAQKASDAVIITTSMRGKSEAERAEFNKLRDYEHAKDLANDVGELIRDEIGDGEVAHGHLQGADAATHFQQS